MTPKQILDSFSETLMQDERILSTQERTLLAALLQHSRTASGQDSETQQAVRQVIAAAVGETVAQRAFSVLGGSIVEKILESNTSSTAEEDRQGSEIYAREPQPPGVRAPKKPVRDTPIPKEPQPPGSQPLRSPKPPQEPQPPGVRSPRKEPPRPVRGPQPPAPPGEPQPPGAPMPIPKEPQPPGSGRVQTVTSTARIALPDRPLVLPAQCVVLDEFLAPQELEQLTRYTLEHEADFCTSEVVSPSAEGGVVNYEHRRSRVLMDLGAYQDLILDRIRTVLPEVLQKLSMEEFSIAGVEAQITASNDGDFFHFHSDNGSERVSARYLTFVYFFHREPAPFEGGELLIHDSRWEDGRYISEGNHQKIVPRQNQIVLFPCELMHEITPVTCPSGRFEDSRFTLNGWLRR